MIEDEMPSDPPVRAVLAVCCCRNEWMVNAGCKLHGIGLLTTGRIIAVDRRQREPLPSGRAIAE